MRMHDAFWPAGGAGGIEHKGRRFGRDVERGAVGSAGCLVRKGGREHRLYGGETPVYEFLLEQRKPRPAVSRRVLQLSVGELVVQRDRHGAGADGAEPGGREVRRVAHEEKHAVSRTHAERGKRSGGARDARGELGKINAFLAADERGTVAVPRQRFSSEQQLRAVHAPGSIKRTVVSPRTSLRHARMMPLARSAGSSACCERSSSTTSPLTSSHLQVPQLPVWHENGNGTPARSSDARTVSPVSTGMRRPSSSRVICMGPVLAATMVAIVRSPNKVDGARRLEARNPAWPAWLQAARRAAGALPGLPGQRRRALPGKGRHPAAHRSEPGRDAGPAGAGGGAGALHH